MKSNGKRIVLAVCCAMAAACPAPGGILQNLARDAGRAIGNGLQAGAEAADAWRGTPPEDGTSAAPRAEEGALPGPDAPGVPPDEAALQAGDTMEILLPGGASMTMVWCPPGTFRMGGTGTEGWPESPVHGVALTHGFWIAKHEVTQMQWRSVEGYNPSKFRGDDLPVEEVDAALCRDFCRTVESASGWPLRLPTEAEWEYACRAGDGDGGDLSSAGWYRNNGGWGTKPVGGKAPNAWGIHDMLGNVWEWCADRPRRYGNEAVANPVGGTGALADSHVLRGGCWDSPASACTPSHRGRAATAGGGTPLGQSCGFRPAMRHPR